MVNRGVRTITKNFKKWMSFSIVSILLIGLAIYLVLFTAPRNSLKLYQKIAFADDFEKVQKLVLDGYEKYFIKEDFDYITSASNVPDSISQMTLFEYEEKTYMLMTTPGTETLKVLAVEELPEEIRQYFKEITPE